MNTFAKLDGSHYILNGTKNWVTNGIHSDYVLVFALTQKDVGHKGISCFLVEKSLDGFDTGKPEEKLGIRSSDTCELYFDNVKIPKENLIGSEGDGFKIALSTLSLDLNLSFNFVTLLILLSSTWLNAPPFPGLTC